jgi:hypothetical protein
MALLLQKLLTCRQSTAPALRSPVKRSLTGPANLLAGACRLTASLEPERRLLCAWRSRRGSSRESELAPVACGCGVPPARGRYAPARSVQAVEHVAGGNPSGLRPVFFSRPCMLPLSRGYKSAIGSPPGRCSPLCPNSRSWAWCGGLLAGCGLQAVPMGGPPSPGLAFPACQHLWPSTAWSRRRVLAPQI